MKNMQKYRLGLDLGANSLGWCLVALDDDDRPYRFLRMGVRLFSDGRNPKDGTSLAAARRLARSMRRRRDRFLKRRERLMRLMIAHGFMPGDRAARRALRSLDPYDLRRRGLDEELTPFEFGRALFHLNQRRGFLSNRVIDKSKDDDKGKINTAIGKVRERMQDENARTIGEWLARRHVLRQAVRARLHGQGARSSYDLYVHRSMIAEEFDRLWEKQATLKPAIFTEAARAVLRDALMFQRRLRPVVPGRCTFEVAEPRAALALPSVQRFRVLQEINHLRIREVGKPDVALTLQQRDLVLYELLRKRDRTFAQLRSLLGLSEDATFNLESPERTRLKGDATGTAMAAKGMLGKRWHELPVERQDEIVGVLLEAEEDDSVAAYLRRELGIADEVARTIAAVPLIDGYGSVSLKAIRKMLPHLERDVVTYDQAAIAAGYDHSLRYDGGDLPKLPYYAELLAQHVGTGTGVPTDPPEKRFGRVSNPTVHVGLNQLRVTVNAIIEKYGRPSQIVIELARELKLNRERKRELEREQRGRSLENARFREDLEQAGLPPKPGNLLKVRLWHELGPPTDRRCPYSGEMISFTRLMSDEVEIEHILPFAKTLDDSPANKTVALRRANRDKGNRTPFEAFGHSPSGYDWEAILNRAAQMLPNKRRKFGPDALDRYQEGGDFLARHLNDTAYLARVAREYLTAVCPSNRVWSIPGRLTALLRSRWGLNTLLSDSDRKNRTDQRHHTVDAAVVAVTDRSLLQRMSTISAHTREDGFQRFLDGLAEPWPGYRQGLVFGLAKIIPSYKPDHGTGGRLHNDTAYGFVNPAADPGKPVEVVHRVPLASFKTADDIDDIRDPVLRERLKSSVSGRSGRDLAGALEQFSAATGIRRVRVIETLSVISVRREDGTAYKAYKGDSNYAFEIVAGDGGRWFDRVISTFSAAGRQVAAPSTGTVVMRLCKDDCVSIEVDGRRAIYRLAQMSPGKAILAPVNEGGDLRERDRDASDPFKYLIRSASSLQRLKARQVVVDPLGQVWERRWPNEGQIRRNC